MSERPWLAAGVEYARKFRSARDAGTSLTIGGVACADVICWSFLRAPDAECGCGGRLAHVFPGACGRAVTAVWTKRTRRQEALLVSLVACQTP